MVAEAHAPDAAEPKKRTPVEERIRSWLSHPLLLLLLGAVVTGILVPSFTHGWQVQQTARDTKTKVIADVSDAASTAMTQLEIDMSPVLNSGVANNGPLNTPQSIAGSYNNWTMKSTNVGSELNAYFPGNNIPTHWGNLSGLIKNFFLLTYATDKSGMRPQYIQQIKSYFDAHHINTGVDWSALQPDQPWTPRYYSNWTRLKHQINAVKVTLISEIMDAPAPSF
jgi:hypothetical protein